MNIELINKKKEEWINNQYKQLTREKYKLWLSEREFSGQGSLCILKSCLFKRNHVVFSKLQEKALLELLYQEGITDIREHYPIFETGNDKVICTTFLISRRTQNNEIVDEAISVVRKINKSNSKRISFQNEFYKEKGISYRVVTEKDLIGQNNKQYNYKLFYKAKCNEAVFESYKKTLLYQELQKQMIKSGSSTVSELIEKYQGQERLQAIEYIKFMVAHKKVQIDWNKKFNLSSNITTILG